MLLDGIDFGRVRRPEHWQPSQKDRQPPRPMDAAPSAAKQAMGYILEVYKVERAALDQDLLGTPEHLEIRQTASRAVMDDFKAWLDAEHARHPPKGPMGEAIGYALGQ